MVASADFTTYGTKCADWPFRCEISEHCRYNYETLDDLVIQKYHAKGYRIDIPGSFDGDKFIITSEFLVDNKYQMGSYMLYAIAFYLLFR